MERQSSRRRRPPRTPAMQDPMTSAPSPEFNSSIPPSSSWYWPRYSLRIRTLLACLVLGLGSLLYASLDLFESLAGWAPPLKAFHPQLHPQLQTLEAPATRPRIELHPQDHVYRAPVTQFLDWRISTGDRRPDGVLKQVYLINDLFPGPTIEARSGDTLIITVTNALSEDFLALHWHGLHVENAMDGAAGVSQCPIAPGRRFIYNVTIPTDQSGTFWYHAHSGTSRADGLYGGLVVHAPVTKSTVRGLMSRGSGDAQRFKYDKELLLLIGDWYHRPGRDVLAWYMLPGSFANEPVPDSLLVNGVGRFECAMAVPARPVDCIDQQANSSFLDLDPDTVYRIRVVNTGALAGLSLVFDQESLDLIQVDSIDVARSDEQDANSAGVLYPGQRMDFVLRSSSQKPTQGSSMMVQLDKECFKYINPALTPDQTFPIKYLSSSISNNTAAISPPIPTTRNTLSLDKIPSSPTILQDLPVKADQTHLVYTKIQKMARNHNIPEGYFNQTTWKPQSQPLAPLRTLPRTDWDVHQLALSTGPSTPWVDFVINNLDEGPHPFHLHGHHFYILAVHAASYGWGSFDPFTDPFPPGLEPDPAADLDSNFQPYDLARAALRDTVLIPSRGYAVLRFRADNPGVWMFHCHILWHLATGMAMLVDVQGDMAGLVAHEAGGAMCV